MFDNINLDKSWLECVDYLVEIGFEKDVAIYFAKMYAFDDNFKGFMKTITTIVETAFLKQEINEALSDANKFKRTMLERFGRSQDAIYDEIELNVGDEFFLVVDKPKSTKGKSYKIERKQETDDRGGKRIEYMYYNDYNKPQSLFIGEYILKF